MGDAVDADIVFDWGSVSISGLANILCSVVLCCVSKQRFKNEGVARCVKVLRRKKAGGRLLDAECGS